MRITPVNIFAAFEATRRLDGGRPFLHIPAHCAGGAVDLTYDQTAAAVQRTADGYRTAGYGPGHHVALLLENRADFFVHWLALNSIGATVVPLGAELTAEEMTFQLRHADVDLLVCLPDRRAAAERAAAPIDDLPIVGADAVASGEFSRGKAPRAAATFDGEAAIVFTSGSTGRPKGCVLSNDYFLSFGNWYRDLGGRCTLRPGAERLITPLPLNHVNALAFSSMGMILTGGCIIQLDRFRSSNWWATVRDSRATVMHYLGVMPAMLLQVPPEPQDAKHALRFGFGGGVRFAHHAAFERRFGVPLIEAWAMTETGGTGTISTHVGARHIGSGCIGQSSAAYSESSIVDEQGRCVAPEQVGELVVRASAADPRKGFFSGYYKEAEATEAAWRGGWLHSGDLARRGADGSIFFVGRRKQVIRRSGENISAAEVEAVLSGDPRIKEVAVVPVADEIREEEVFAFIIVQPGVAQSSDTVGAVLATAGASLSYFKMPAYVAFVDALPVTATQKLRYGVLVEKAESLLSGPDPRLFDMRHAKRRAAVARP